MIRSRAFLGRITKITKYIRRATGLSYRDYKLESQEKEAKALNSVCVNYLSFANIDVVCVLLLLL